MATSIFGKLHRRYGRPPSQSELHNAAAAKVRALEADGREDARVLSHSQFSPGQTVAVIGGGLSGLCAAYYLARNGATVMLFEASNHLGGRVRTSNSFVKGRLIESGAELIGLNHPLWLKLAREFGLSLSVVTPESHYSGAGLDLKIRIGGRVVPPDELKDIFQEIDQTLAQMNTDAATLDAFAPWLSRHLPVSDWDALSVKDWINTHATRLSPEARRMLEFDLENDQTVPVSQQSYLGLLCAVKAGNLTTDLLTTDAPSDYWTQTEIFRCSNGNQELAEQLRRAIRTHVGVIHFEKPVDGIQAATDGVSIHLTDAGTLYFNWVVVAAPVAAYSSISISGFPVGPTAMNWGPAAKYLSHVDKRFWIENSIAPSGADDRFGAFWEGTDNQAAIDTLEFDLSLFGGGNANAAAVTPNTAAEKQVLHDKINGTVTGYTGAVRATQVINWPEEKWIKMGYSCPGKGQVLAEGQFLNQLHGRLVFAGEHTSMGYFGYMEGALQSGLRAASQVIGRVLPA